MDQNSNQTGEGCENTELVVCVKCGYFLSSRKSPNSKSLFPGVSDLEIWTPIYSFHLPFSENVLCVCNINVAVQKLSLVSRPHVTEVHSGYTDNYSWILEHVDK